ncbi:MAG: 4'-phosphopantetheinyl transferase superfamily protein [Desulfobacteraceae bacterium]|nr:4'-phosphopantetheinyl transferase superfamily protein [Desulfobacteraceae bacterium]
MPPAGALLKGRARVEALGRYARQSLRISGERSGFHPGTLLKGEAGEPLSCNGVHWSISHKPDFVAGVVSHGPAGIDIERVKPVSDSLFNRLLSPEEFACFGGGDRVQAFFRTFTAKEAVLKGQGVGLAGLSMVRVVGAPAPMVTRLDYQGSVCTVEHFWVDGHIASVVRDESDVVWECVDTTPCPCGAPSC